MQTNSFIDRCCDAHGCLHKGRNKKVLKNTKKKLHQGGVNIINSHTLVEKAEKAKYTTVMRKKDVRNASSEIMSNFSPDSNSDGDLKKQEEESDSDNERKTILSQEDELNKDLESLHISCSNESDYEGSDEDFVPKGLVSEKEARREKRSEETKPYSVRKLNITSGGNTLDFALNIPFDDSDSNRPTPVVEHDDSIHFTREEFLLLNEIYEKNCSSDTDGLPSSSPLQSWSSDLSYKYCENDPRSESSQNREDAESGYASNSPCPSVCSPNSSSPDSRVLQNIPTELKNYFYTEIRPHTSSKPFYTKEVTQFSANEKPPINSLCVDLTLSQKNGISNKQIQDKFRDRSKNLQPVTQTIVNDSDKVKPACERIQNKLLKREKVQIHWLRVANEKPHEFLSINNDKTKLMNELMCKDIHRDFNEIIYARTQRCKRHLDSIPNIKYRDQKDRNALLIAALYHPQRPFIARLIADAYVELDTTPDESFAHSNSIFHILAAGGDSYAEVFAELLHVVMKNGQKAFNVNSINDESQTPLHVAAKTHKPPNISTFVISKLLIKHGADLSIQDNNGSTPLHLAISTHCDPNFIKNLLENPWARDSLNLKDSMSNTPLHLAASRNDINFEKQKQVINHLMTSNSQQTHNSLGKLPLALVVPQRREEIRKILQNKGK